MEMYCRASNTGHVMRRDDRVPRTACAPATHWPGQVNGMRDEDEDEQSKKKKRKAALSTSLSPLPALRRVADLQVMAFFSFIPLSLKKRLDGADCF